MKTQIKFFGSEFKRSFTTISRKFLLLPCQTS